MDEPPRKRPKKENDCIFWKFKEDEDLIKQLKLTCESVYFGHAEMNVRLLRIEETNARAIETFSNATCMVSEYENDQGLPILYTFGSLFSDGVATLLEYVKEGGSIPKDVPSRKALSKLLKFLNSGLSSINRPGKNIEESEWAIQLAEHLLSQLSVERKYTLERHYVKSSLRSEDEKVQCPCGKESLSEDRFGDTSFGCPDAWHGNTDICMENIAVRLTSDREADALHTENSITCRLSSDSSDDGNETSVEGKNVETFCERELSQMMARCIVFSFLQRKLNEQTMKNYLVPYIGINRSKLVFHFYDSKNDILFQSADFDLFYQNTLDVRTVILLWLTLNYNCFCSGITDDMKEYKANFCDHVGNYISKYETEVKRPLENVQIDREARTGWARRFGIYRHNTVSLEFVSLKNISEVNMDEEED